PVWFSATLVEMSLDSRASASMNLSMELQEGDATPTQTTELLHNREAAISPQRLMGSFAGVTNLRCEKRFGSRQNLRPSRTVLREDCGRTRQPMPDTRLISHMRRPLKGLALGLVIGLLGSLATSLPRVSQ